MVHVLVEKTCSNLCDEDPWRCYIEDSPSLDTWGKEIRIYFEGFSSIWFILLFRSDRIYIRNLNCYNIKQWLILASQPQTLSFPSCNWEIQRQEKCTCPVLESKRGLALFKNPTTHYKSKRYWYKITSYKIQVCKVNISVIHIPNNIFHGLTPPYSPTLRAHLAGLSPFLLLLVKELS